MNKMICEKFDSIEACELYTRNSLQNQSVFSPTHAQLQQRTAVHHQCDICTKSFTRSSDLTKHKLIHSGIKKYQCDVCSKSLTRKDKLAQHMLIPVSYTHLDVYKRQVLTRIKTTAESTILQKWKIQS